jgi:hypothetical protein
VVRAKKKDIKGKKTLPLIKTEALIGEIARFGRSHQNWWGGGVADINASSTELSSRSERPASLLGVHGKITIAAILGCSSTSVEDAAFWITSPK